MTLEDEHKCVDLGVEENSLLTRTYAAHRDTTNRYPWNELSGGWQRSGDNYDVGVLCRRQACSLICERVCRARDSMRHAGGAQWEEAGAFAGGGDDDRCCDDRREISGTSWRARASSVIRLVLYTINASHVHTPSLTSHLRQAIRPKGIETLARSRSLGTFCGIATDLRCSCSRLANMSTRAASHLYRADRIVDCPQIF